MGDNLPEKNGKAQVLATNKGLMPKSFDEMYRMANIMLASGMMPKNFGRVEEVFVAVQMGAEAGLSPMQAVQNIAVINGKPSLYGDGALGVVWASGLMEDFREEPILDGDEVVGYRCTAKRKGSETPISREFTIADAERAGLLNKRGPWQEYRARMFQMRARAWTLRDGFADALKGLCIREEIEDIKDAEARVVENTARSTEELKQELDAVLDGGARESSDSDAPDDDEDFSKADDFLD